MARYEINRVFHFDENGDGWEYYYSIRGRYCPTWTLNEAIKVKQRLIKQDKEKRNQERINL